MNADSITESASDRSFLSSQIVAQDMRPHLYIALPSFGDPVTMRALDRCFAVTKTPGSRPSTAQLGNIFRQSDAVIIGAQEQVNKEILELSNRRLTLLGVCAVGLDNIDTLACSRAGVTVLALPHEVNATTVAEFTVGSIIAALRRIPEAHSALSRGDWSWRLQHRGRDLAGKTVGVIGTGHIGGEVITRLAPFGVCIYAYAKDEPQNAFLQSRYGVEYVDLAELLTVADIVTVHVPLTHETHRLLGAGQLNTMKKDVVLVNTSRGAILAEDALLELLKKRPRMHAILDVFENEPEYPQQFVRLPNVQLTPHIAGTTIESWKRKEHRLVELLCEHIRSSDEEKQ